MSFNQKNIIATFACTKVAIFYGHPNQSPAGNAEAGHFI